MKAWTIAILVGVAGTSGCVPLALGRAAVAVLPIVTTRAAPSGAHGSRALEAVPDSGKFWSRDVLSASGAPLNVATYRDGDPAIVRWAIPFQTQAQVEAVAALVDPGCEASARAPIGWGLTRPTGVPAPGEVWYVSRTAALTRPMEGPVGGTGSIIGAWAADALRARLGLPGSARLGWVIVAPQSGAYDLAVTWAVGQAGSLGTSPCIRAWVAVPLPWVVDATRGIPEASPDSTLGPRVAVADTSDLGVGAGYVGTSGAAGKTAGTDSSPADGSVVSRSTMSGQAPAAGTIPLAAETGSVVTDTASVARQIGLLGTPAFDLQRIHQAGIDLEYAPVFAKGSPGAVVSENMAVALRELRLDRLARLRRDGTSGRVAICTLVRQGVGARPLKVWGDKPTIPVEDQAPCLSTGRVSAPRP